MNRFHLGLGIAVTFICAALFGWVADAVDMGGRIVALDVDVGRWLQLHRAAALTQAMLLVSLLHSTIAVACYAGVAGLLALRQRLWRRTAMLAASVGGILALNALVKLAFHRHRPDFDPVSTLATYSFPSGHVAASTVMYLLGLTWVFERTPSPSLRLAAVFAAACGVALVALSRMYLGVHYLSDVLAAFTEGFGWAALCFTCLTVVRGHADATMAQPGLQSTPPQT